MRITIKKILFYFKKLRVWVYPRKSLQSKLSCIFLLGALLPLLVASLLFYFQARVNTRDSIKQNMSNLTSELGALIDWKILNAVTHLKLLANNEIIYSTDISMDEKQKEMRKICDLFKTFDDITLLDVNGIVLTSLKYDFRGDWRYKKWFKIAIEGKSVVSSVHIIPNPVRYVIVITAPVIDDKGNICAVLAGRIGMEGIWAITDRIKIGKTGFVFITDVRGNILSHPDKSKILEKITPENLNKEIVSTCKSAIFEYIDEENVPKVCFYSELKRSEKYAGENWWIGIIQHEKEAYAIIHNMIGQVFVMGIGFGSLIFILAILFSRKITKPIKLLMGMAGKIANGDLESRVNFSSDDELGQLADSFNKMSIDLKRTTTSISNLNMEIEERKKTEETLKKSEERFKFASLATNEVIWDWDLLTNNVYWSEGIKALFNYTMAETHQIDWWAQNIHPDDKQRVVCGINDNIDKGYETWSDEYRFKRKDDSYATIIDRGFVIHDDNGKAVRMIGSMMDITERKKSEETLRELNEQLEISIDKLTAANHELANFAHITAHDLKAPLRAIGCLAGMISLDYKDKLDDQGKEMLNMLFRRAERMSNQISSILHYSEIGRSEEKKDRVDLNLTVKEAIDNINVPENIKITIENELPIVICQKNRIFQVFQNLIDNAIKCIDKTQGQINIGCVADGNWWKFSVSDNGIGIEKEYFEKIFQIFQTLVRRDEKEAIGIGLSIVKKIIESHGGKVWVESKVSQGSTFFFTLAKHEMRITNEKLQTNIVS